MVSVDTETTGDNIYDGRDHCMGVSVCFEEYNQLVAFYLPLRHSNVGLQQGENLNLHQFLPLLQALIDNCLIIYHNAKFDLVSLETLGLSTITGRFVDTMVLAHLVDENKPLTGKSLDSCARYYLHDDKGKRKSEDLKMLTKHFGWGILTPGILCKYAVWDAVLTFQFFKKLQPLLAKESLAPVWQQKSDFLRLLIKMEAVGIRTNKELCVEMAETGHKEMDRIVSELGFNPASRNELAQYLIEDMGLPERYHFKTGRRTFDKDAMAFYDEVLEQLDDPTARKIIEFRGWQKSVSSNYEPYINRLSPDGRIRSSFMQHRTVTGRLASKEPNLQQIPKVGTKPWNGRMRQCFVAAPGYVLVSVDFSQLELRLATVYAQEPTLMEAFLAGRDIFMLMSQQLGLSRDTTKMLVYLIQYGGKQKRLSLSAKISVLRAKEMIDNFHRTYPRLKAVSDKYEHLASKYGQIKLWTGRRRHFLYPDEEAYTAYSGLIQGGAADVVEHALLKLDRQGFINDDCRLLLQIHDEGLFEIKEELADEIAPAIAQSMGEVDYHPHLTTVKFKAVYKRWAT